MNKSFLAYAQANRLAPTHSIYGGFLSLAVMKRHDADDGLPGRGRADQAAATAGQYPEEANEMANHGYAKYTNQLLGDRCRAVYADIGRECGRTTG